MTTITFEIQTAPEEWLESEWTWSGGFPAGYDLGIALSANPKVRRIHLIEHGRILAVWNEDRRSLSHRLERNPDIFFGDRPEDTAHWVKGESELTDLYSPLPDFVDKKDDPDA